MPGLANWTRARDHRVYQLSQSGDAALFLSSPLSADDIAEFGADTITVATGSRWRSDGVGSANFEPLDLGNIRVLSPDDIMDGAAAKLPKTEFVVYDDDHFYMADAVAESLIASGHSVIFVCHLPSIAAWTEYTLDQCRIVERLVGLGADIRPNLKLEAAASFATRLPANMWNSTSPAWRSSVRALRETISATPSNPFRESARFPRRATALHRVLFRRRFCQVTPLSVVS